jgi:steroid 5-alpha reductase family enzyme
VLARAFAWVCLAYFCSLALALVVGHLCPPLHPIYIALIADVAATIGVFAFSFYFRNTSFYDPYWSVVPIVIGIYWAMRPAVAMIDPVRVALVLFGLAFWGGRLTYNWARGWQGLGHEDWRYVEKQREFPRTYWLVSFGGLHMVPTFLVFAACVPAYAALALPTRPIGWLDVVATLVVGTAIFFEATADAQLRSFRATPKAPGETLTTGLWGRSRHPNYFGEILFWWGIYLFGLAANPSWYASAIGAILITLLFLFVSLPMIERRALERRENYAKIVQDIPLLIPWPRRSRAQSRIKPPSGTS